MLPANFGEPLVVHASAGHDVAEHLTPKFREHARNHGVPEHIASKLVVSYHADDDRFGFDVSDPKLREEYLDWEYGTATSAPSGFTRAFSASHARAAADAFGTAVMRRAHGR